MLFLLMVQSEISQSETHDGFIRLFVFGPAVPHQNTEYAVERSAGVSTFRVERKGYGSPKKRQEVTLITPSQWDELTSEILNHRPQTQAFEPGITAVNYRIEFQLKGRTGRLELSEIQLARQKALWDWVKKLRLLESDRFEPMVFWDGDLSEKTSGLLWLSSSPQALVTIDSVPLNAQTPIRHIRLSEGKHSLVLTRIDDGSTWPYEVVIKAGTTTRLEVELR